MCINILKKKLFYFYSLFVEYFMKYEKRSMEPLTLFNVRGNAMRNKN